MSDTLTIRRELVALSMINSATVTDTRVTVQGDGIKIVKCLADIATWWDVYLSDQADEDDLAELADLERQLGKPLSACLVEREVHPCIPGLIGTFTYYRRYSTALTEEVIEP